MKMQGAFKILAFDTSGPYCAAAFSESGDVRAEAVVEMARGQAEALLPLLEDTLASRNHQWSDLDALAVGIGPGNFTGIRIGVSAARGLALSLGIPAIGVSTFELMAFHHGERCLVCLDAPRGQAFVQPFYRGQATGAARLIDPDAPPADLLTFTDTVLVGHAVERIGQHFDCSISHAEIEDLPKRLCQIAMRRHASGGEIPRPAPLYVRSADALPSSDTPPMILDDA